MVSLSQNAKIFTPFLGDFYTNNLNRFRKKCKKVHGISSFLIFRVFGAGFWPLQRQISSQNPFASAGGIIVNEKLFLSFTIILQFAYSPIYSPDCKSYYQSIILQ